MSRARQVGGSARKRLLGAPSIATFLRQTEDAASRATVSPRRSSSIQPSLKKIKVVDTSDSNTNVPATSSFTSPNILNTSTFVQSANNVAPLLSTSPVTANASIANSTFVMLSYMVHPRTVYFIRVQGNEEFLSGSRADPNGGLLHALKDVRSVVIGQRYFTFDGAKSAMQRELLQLVGFVVRIFDITIMARWTARLWDDCNRCLVTLLERRIALSVASESANSILGSGIVSSTRSTSNVSSSVTAGLEGQQKRNQRALFLQYAMHFQHFCSWLSTVLDEFAVQLLPRLPLLVFQHCYFDLLMHSSSESAVLFFERFAPLFDPIGALSDRHQATTTTTDFERVDFKDTAIFILRENQNSRRYGYGSDSETLEKLRAMRLIRTQEQMANSEICRYMRLRRDPQSNQFTMQPLAQTFYVSTDCYRFLQHNIVLMLMPKIAVVMRTYINFVALPHRPNISHHSSSNRADSNRADSDFIVVNNCDHWRSDLASLRQGEQQQQQSSSTIAEFSCRAAMLDYTLNFAAYARAQMEALDRKFGFLSSNEK